MQWETTLTPTETGDYNLGVETDGFFRVFLDGKPVTMANYPHGVETLRARYTWKRARRTRCVVEYQTDRQGGRCT